jgi:GWxTD domain-containing protein
MTIRALTITLAVLIPAAAWSQIDLPRVVPEGYSESLFIDPVAFAGPTADESRLDVFVQMGYDNLSFVKQENAYNASYEITITVHDSVGALVSEKSWSDDLKGLTFDQSVASGAYVIQQRSIVVRPGRYQVAVVVRDLDSKVSKRTMRECLVPDYAASPFTMSDVLLLSRLSVRGPRKSITPNISPNVGNVPDAFFAFMEVYNRAGDDSIRFVGRVVTPKGAVLLAVDSLQYMRKGKNEAFLRIPHMTLPLGDYILMVSAYPPSAPRGRDTLALASSSRPFIIRWRGLPRGTKDIDAAIEQLQYIAKDAELTELKSATTNEEKQKKFLEFWKKRDPNPSTPRNEKMEAFYARVEYANRHFSHYREGWRTDMGLVYIVLGTPSNVERHPFEIDSKPYEIWSYYDINYQYVFVDETGFGDYRLLSPLWEVYNRRRE